MNNPNLTKISELIARTIDITFPGENDQQFGSQFTLLNVMPSPSTGIMPELAIVAAARTSFLGESTTIDRDKKLFQYLYKHQHVSPSEMSEIFFVMNSVPAQYVQELVEDPRWKLSLMRGTDNNIFIRIDLNNIVAYYKQSSSDPQCNPIKIFLKQILEVVYPWTAQLLGSNPSLQMKPSNEVSFGQPTDVKRYMMDDGYGDRWVEMHENTGTDEKLSHIIHEVYPDKAKYTPQENIEFMFLSGDLRPLSLFSVKFALRAPVLVLWQLVRHRSGSFNFQSGRYMAFGEDDLYLPNKWRKQSTSNKQGSSDEVLTPSDFSELLLGLTDSDNLATGKFADESYKTPVAEGDNVPYEYSKLLAEYYAVGHEVYQAMLNQGAAKEQARLFLPAWASLYTAVVKFDLMFFMRFLRLRTAPDAQLEIRNYANMIYHVWESSMPVTANLAKKYNFLGS